MKKPKYYIICVEQGIARVMPKQHLCDKKGNERVIYAYTNFRTAENHILWLLASQKRMWDYRNNIEPTSELYEPNEYFISTTKI